MLRLSVILAILMISAVSSRGMMTRRAAETESPSSSNLMDENINFAEQILEVRF